MFTKNEDTLFRTPSYAEEQLEHALKKEAEKTTQETKPDIINHPKHYTQGEIECIQVIEYINRKLSLIGFEGFCLGNFIKYIWRCNDKNGWEDIDKAIFYMDKFLQEQYEDD